ncbi:HEAT repeat domain-containing protein [Pseudodesulfovibrio sp.]|nr:HEAT repeat domain-containing protein [Pseudodesulfovibrio sp.]
MQLDIRQFMSLSKPGLFLCVTLALFLTTTSASAGNPAEDGPRIGGIVAHLTDNDEAVRVKHMRQLMEYGQSAMPFLVGIREYGSPAQRRGAIVGMALLPIPALAAEDLMDALGDDDLATRSLAAHSLALIGPSAAPGLTAALSGDRQTVRDAAAYALTLMGQKSVPALTHALASDNIFVRSKAAWLLGAMGSEATSAVPALIRALDTKDMRVMHVVAEAIDLIGPDPALVYYHLILIGSEPGTLPLRRVGGNAAPVLVRLLTRPGTPLAQIAFRALASIGRDAMPALKAALQSGTPSQRTAAALLLVDIDPAMVHELPEDVRSSLAGATRQPEQ